VAAGAVYMPVGVRLCLRRDHQHRCALRWSQVKEEAMSIAAHCGGELSATALSADGHPAAQRAAISTAGQVVVATPGLVAQVGRTHGGT
jgi:hypothetical protein